MLQNLEHFYLCYQIWLGSGCRNIYLSPEFDADTDCDVDEIRELLLNEKSVEAPNVP
jgi:hypothetical protein